MTDRSQSTDPFEEALAASLARYAADAGSTGDAYAIADTMLEARRQRRFRIGLAAISGVLATAVVAGIAIGALAEPQRHVGPGPTESVGPTESLTPSSEPTSETLPGVVAPEACGFPDGTGLSFAGRSTTAALDVQEVVGDSWSFEPADIYITSEKQELANGIRGRQVCAIFANADFVEVTMHPEDGGRFFPAPSSTAFESTCSPSPTPAARGGDGSYRVTATELWEAGQCGDALAKYGGTDLILVAYPSGIGAVDPCPPLEPSWFNSCAKGLFLSSPGAPEDEYGRGPMAMAVIHPDLGVMADILDELYPRAGETTLMRFTAHFDDPAASECRYEEWAEDRGPSPSPSDVVEQCRNTLVITAFETVEP